MKKIISLFVFAVLFAYYGNAQDILEDMAKAKPKEKVKRSRNLFSVGVSYGIDKNLNAYRFNENKFGNFFHNDKLYNNITLDLGIYASKKLRTRLEFKYLKMGYTADWENTGIPEIKETVVEMTNFSGSFHMDYTLLTVKKFDFLVSSAIRWEYTEEDDFYNEKTDGTTNDNNFNNIITEYPKQVYGAVLSGIVKYNLTKHIGITLTPEYTFFFSKFVSSNDKYYQRMSVNAGLEFAF